MIHRCWLTDIYREEGESEIWIEEVVTTKTLESLVFDVTRVYDIM